MRNTLLARKVAKSLLSPFGPKQPRTPIRWLCLKSFSYLGEVQNKSLAKSRFDLLNQAIELGVYLNRCFDRKHAFRLSEYRRLRKELPAEPTRTYLRELKTLELERSHLFEWSAVFHYRRSVLQVSLNYLFCLSRLQNRQVLLPLCSLIQLMDDVLDQELDRELGLPTFLCADGPQPSILAASFWGEIRSNRSAEDRPFVLAGWFVYLFARILIMCRPACNSYSKSKTQGGFTAFL
jgi:hypothetical protein